MVARPAVQGAVTNKLLSLTRRVGAQKQGLLASKMLFLQIEVRQRTTVRSKSQKLQQNSQYPVKGKARIETP